MYQIATPFIKKWEQYVGSPYYCPAYKLTLGYGDLIKSKKLYNGVEGGFLISEAKKIKNSSHSRETINTMLVRRFGVLISEKEASDNLEVRMRNFWRSFAYVLPEGMSDNQCAACLSLAYNIGVSGFKKSSVLKHLKEGDIQKAADAFLLWNKHKDRDGRLIVSRGLNNRRKSERELFLAGA